MSESDQLEEADGVARTPERVRHEILCHAGALFQHFGFHKTTVADIAERAGMSPGNLYRYYRNKADIGCAVVAGFFRMSEADMQTALMLPAGSSEDRLRAMIHAGVGHLVREMSDNPRLIELADWISENDQGLEVLLEHIAWRQARFAEEIGRGHAAGELRTTSPEATARALHNATKAFWVPTMLAKMPRSDNVPALLDEVLDLIFEGMRR